MKKFLLSLVLLLSSAMVCCWAQDVRRWGEGLPDWSGFRVADEADSPDYFVSFTLLRDKKVVRKDGVTYKYMDYTGAILPYMSWVKAEAMNEARLSVVRKDFDILEYYARILRDELLFTFDKDKEKEKEFNQRFQAAREAAHATGDYTKYMVARDSFDVSKIQYETAVFHHGVTVGLFSNIPFGDQGRLVYPSAGLAVVYEFGHERGGFQAEINVGASPFRRHYLGLNRKLVPYMSAFTLYRGEVARNDKWRFSLYGGPGYSTRNFEEYDTRKPVGGLSFCGGVCADFLLGRTVSLSSRHPEQSNRFLQFKLSCNQMYNSRQRKVVPSVNLSAGLWFQSTSIKRK